METVSQHGKLFKQLIFDLEISGIARNVSYLSCPNGSHVARDSPAISSGKAIFRPAPHSGNAISKGNTTSLCF